MPVKARTPARARAAARPATTAAKARTPARARAAATRTAVPSRFFPLRGRRSTAGRFLPMPANRFNADTDYGIGIGLRVPHYTHILQRKPVVDWFEIISENFMVDGGRPLEVLGQIL